MPQIRQNPVTKEWVIIATERAKRPEDFKDRLEEPERKLPEHEPNCPFCPGNEDKTPPQVFALPQEGEWQVRVIPNKFAALNRNENLDQHCEGLRWSVNGAGIHDVIIETRKHNLTTALMSTEQIRMIIEAYRIHLSLSINSAGLSLAATTGKPDATYSNIFVDKANCINSSFL